MKKFAVLTLVVVMLAVSMVPAFAAGGLPANRGTGSGVCTGNQDVLGSGYQAGLGAGYQAGFGASNQKSYGVRTPYALSGTIYALDPAASTVTVTVSCGNRLVNPYIGNEVTLQTTEITRFLLRNSDGSVTPITFAELEVGENVSSHGILADGVFTATRVTMGALLNCLP
ncbi:MAG: hypothetical protein WAV05_17870 [Anaerolineales bacterium]